jgi:hypothetical protein
MLILWVCAALLLGLSQLKAYRFPEKHSQRSQIAVETSGCYSDHYIWMSHFRAETRTLVAVYLAGTTGSHAVTPNGGFRSVVTLLTWLSRGSLPLRCLRVIRFEGLSRRYSEH